MEIQKLMDQKSKLPRDENFPLIVLTIHEKLNAVQRERYSLKQKLNEIIQKERAK